MLALKGLTKRFGAATVIDNLTVDFAPGLVHAVIGPNGAGKSTFVNLVAGSYRPSAGAIVVGGRDVAGAKKWQIARAGVARTYQNIRLFDEMSVAENVEAGMVGGDGLAILREIFGRRRRHRAAARAVLGRYGLAEEADRPARTLPYGRQKLLEIARAMAREPQVILLDEPAAGLNPSETLILRDHILALRRPDRVVVFVEHDMELVMSTADRVVVIDRGRLLRVGSPAEIATDPVVRDVYLGTEHEHGRTRSASEGGRPGLGLRRDRGVAWHQP